MTLRTATDADLYRELAARGYVVRLVGVGPVGDVETLPAVALGAASLDALLSALACRGVVVRDYREATAPYGRDSWEALIARPSWMQRHGSALAFWILAAIVTAGMAMAATLTGCRRTESQAPPIKAAPSDHRVEDDCPGGVCTIPPRKVGR